MVYQTLESLDDSKTAICRIPTWLSSELKDLIFRSLPLVFVLVLQLTFNITVTIFVGRLGELELAGTGMALTVLSFTQTGMAQGMSTACDTLFAQAYGANKKKLIGLYLQRSIMFAILFILLVWSFFLVIEPIIVVIGIDPAVAKITADYLLLYMPGMMFNVVFQILSKYLIAQYIVTQVTWMTVFGNVVNIGSHVLFVTYLEMGSRGSAIALSLASASLTIAMLAYIIGARIYTDTWAGWSAEAFYDWHILAKYAIPGMAMLSLEYIGYEMGAVMAGVLGPIYLSSITVYSQIGPFIFTLYHALGTSCAFRVGAKLGSDDVTAAVRCTKVTYGAALFLSVCAMVLLTLLKHEIPKIFTEDLVIIDIVADMLQVNVFYAIAIGLTTIQCGVLRGCGRQIAGASIHLIGYFICCIPVGACLMFLTELKVVGFLVGVGSGLWTELFILSVLLWFTDWQKQAEKAKLVMSASGHAYDDSRMSLLHGGSRLGLPYKSGDKIDDIQPDTESTNDVSIDYGSIPKHKQKRGIPRRQCNSRLFLKRAATFGVVLLIFLTAVTQKVVLTLNEAHTSNNASSTVNPWSSNNNSTNFLHFSRTE